MIGYVCKYTPVEVFEAMGVEIRRIQPEVTNFNQADTLMHPNICSFTKSVLEDVLAGDYEGVVLTTCCDSIRRLPGGGAGEDPAGLPLPAQRGPVRRLHPDARLQPWGAGRLRPTGGVSAGGAVHRGRRL